MSAPTSDRASITTELPISYAIEDSFGLLHQHNPRLASTGGVNNATSRRLVVVDDAIHRLYGDRITAYFRHYGVDMLEVVLQGNEGNKTLESALSIIDAMDAAGTKRTADPVIVIGGGVVCDVVGLAASLYRRGVPYIRVPTTLLSQVDVSVAAKTAVNHNGYRNRLGSYHPAMLTLIDREFLSSVPERHIRNGMGEVLKMALIKDSALFELLESHGADLISSKFQNTDDAHALAAEDVIDRAIIGMADELEGNLFEKDLQRIVDYGHSFSPLIEMRALPELLHGEAVATDCVFSAVLAAQRGLIDTATLHRVVSATRRLGLEPSHSLYGDVSLLQEALADTIKHRNGDQHLPMLTGIGATTFINDLTDAEIELASATMVTMIGG